MSFIELENISFRYDSDEPLVFDSFSMELEKSECLLLEGDNGSGKTTLFRILNGLSWLEQGTYMFDGTEITKKYLKDNNNSKLFHKRIGYLFQNPDIMLFNARVYDEIAFGPRQMGMTDSEVDERVKECLELFGLESISGKAPYHLSGGQKKKVAMASVLSLNPEVIIFDEPFAGLDRKSADWFRTLLKELKAAGKTMIIATHSEEIGADMADRVLNLSE